VPGGGDGWRSGGGGLRFREREKHTRWDKEPRLVFSPLGSEDLLREGLSEEKIAPGAQRKEGSQESSGARSVALALDMFPAHADEEGGTEATEKGGGLGLAQVQSDDYREMRKTGKVREKGEAGDVLPIGEATSLGWGGIAYAPTQGRGHGAPGVGGGFTGGEREFSKKT